MRIWEILIMTVEYVAELFSAITTIIFNSLVAVVLGNILYLLAKGKMKTTEVAKWLLDKESESEL